MAFSATYIEITLRYILLGQRCQTARVYAWDGAAVAAASAEQLGEAWWNHYKDAWRGLVGGDTDVASFQSVVVREVGGSLSFGEFSVPLVEQAGTRDPGDLEGQMPSYCAVGCRFTVGSRVTRPGQMRIPFLDESDVSLNVVGATFLGLCQDLAELYSAPNILGAPVATGEIIPSVVTFGASPDIVTAGQTINGYILNSFITSQVSRRYGHGS